MGKHRDRTDRVRSKTLPSSPSHSSSSSDFEFTITVSPRKSSAALCPADELFYKGQLLPLHLSPRISMVRTLLLSSPSTSSSATASASRDSTGSASSTDSSSSFASDLALLASGIGSSRPSSVADDESDLLPKKQKKSNYFSLSRFSNVFKKDTKSPQQSGSAPAKTTTTTSSSSSSSSSAKEMFRKYLKKVKPLYDKLSQKQTNNTTPFCSKPPPVARSAVEPEVLVSPKGNSVNLSQSFSGNLGYPRKSRRTCVASCPSSMRSSPSHSGVLTRTGDAAFYSDNSTMEELQSAIQGAIAHCKNSMVQSNKASTSRSVLVGVSNEI